MGQNGATTYYIIQHGNLENLHKTTLFNTILPIEDIPEEFRKNAE